MYLRIIDDKKKVINIYSHFNLTLNEIESLFLFNKNFKEYSFNFHIEPFYWKLKEKSLFITETRNELSKVRNYFLKEENYEFKHYLPSPYWLTSLEDSPSVFLMYHGNFEPDFEKLLEFCNKEKIRYFVFTEYSVY